MLLMIGGVQELEMFPLWFVLLGGSFVFLDMDFSILFHVFPFFWVLWLIYVQQGFIILKVFKVFSALLSAGKSLCTL
jgi:hypothetical protein